MLYFTFFSFFSQEIALFLPVPTHFRPLIPLYIVVFTLAFMVLPRLYGFILQT